MESHALAAVELPDVLTCKRKNLWMIILLRTFTSTYIVRICLSIMAFFFFGQSYGRNDRTYAQLNLHNGLTFFLPL